MNRRGFTLIELMTIISILAIIVLIGTPIVNRIIDSSEKSGAEKCMQSIEHAADLYYYNKKLEPGFRGAQFNCKDGACSNNGEILKINGTVPDNGVIIISKTGTVTLNSMVINGYNCYKENENFICEKSSTSIESSDNGTLIVNSSKTNLKNYQIYGNSIENELFTNIPEEYQPVEYIEGTGNQYIDTGLKPTNTTKAEVEFELTESGVNVSQYIIGSRLNTGSSVIFGLNGSINNLNFSGILMGKTKGTYTRQTNTRYRNSLEVEYTEGSGYRGKTIINDLKNKVITSFYTSYVSSGITGDTSNLYLFAFHTANIHKGLRIYNSKIWENGNLVRHFIPCYKKSNKVLGLYDIVENKFYVNSGSGSFLSGNDIIEKHNHVGDLITDESNQNKGKYQIPINIKGKNLFVATTKWNYNDFGVTINSNLGTSVFSINGTANKDKGHLVAITGPKLQAGDYKIKIEGTNNLNYYVQGLEDDGTLIKNYNSGLVTNKTYKITLDQISIIRVGITLNINTNYANEYKVIIQKTNNDNIEYEPYKEAVYNIYLDEPLRKINTYTDYIDFNASKVIRNVSIDKNGNLKELETPVEEIISLPNLILNKGINNLTVDTKIYPSNLTVEYYK